MRWTYKDIRKIMLDSVDPLNSKPDWPAKHLAIGQVSVCLGEILVLRILSSLVKSYHLEPEKVS
jgi:hypothetical protein